MSVTKIKIGSMACYFCDFESDILHHITLHMMKEHRDKLDTNYNPAAGIWTYFRVREEVLRVGIGGK